MDAGHVLQVGTPYEIYEHPTTRFVADFIGETNFLEGEVIDVLGALITVLVDGEAQIQATSDGHVQTGQAVTVVIRPEKFNLEEEGMVKGKVKEVIYIGTDTRYIIQLTGRTEVVIREQNTDPSRMSQVREGDEIGVAWNPAHALVLTE
jgi:spermidine/putrescine transport system ATP-binding protein